MNTTKEKKNKRKEKSLGELCKKFVFLYGNQQDSVISLDHTSEKLGVERRRIYDIINILESFDVVSRLGKNTYNWKGLYRIPITISRLASEASQVTYRKDKSLGLLCLNFIKLFIHYSPVLSLKQAAKQISDCEDEQHIKTKIRRLYDIANVLSFLRLTKKTHISNKPAYEWLGADGFEDFVHSMPFKITSDMQVWAPNQKVSTPCFDKLMSNIVSSVNRQVLGSIENQLDSRTNPQAQIS